MDVGGAYGGGKAGAPFDPLVFIQRPIVLVRGACLFFALIVFSCASVYVDIGEDKNVCIYNKESGACSFGKGVGFIAVAGSVAFLCGEYLFEQMSSVKTRKHYVLGDVGFSSFWAFMYFIAFWYLSNGWSKTTDRPKNDEGVTSAQMAIVFCFFSIFSWAVCAYFAYLRYKQGTDAAFASSFEADPSGGGGMMVGQGYTSYPDATDAAYQEPPFGQQQQQQQQQPQYGVGGANFQAPTY